MNNAINVYTFPRYKEICALNFAQNQTFLKIWFVFNTLK